MSDTNTNQAGNAGNNSTVKENKNMETQSKKVIKPQDTIRDMQKELWDLKKAADLTGKRRLELVELKKQLELVSMAKDENGKLVSPDTVQKMKEMVKTKEDQLHLDKTRFHKQLSLVKQVIPEMVDELGENAWVITGSTVPAPKE